MLNDPTRRRFLLAAAGGAIPGGESPLAEITVLAGGTLTAGGLTSRCALGRSGVRRQKQEGDGATPAGRYPLRRVLFRPDRIASVATALPTRPIGARDGWCTDPADPDYNQQVTLPRSGPHESLWRNDNLYDVVVVIGYNDAPVVPGKGSAIFLHIARPAMTPTDGCIALPRAVLLELVERCDTTTVVDIHA